MVAAKVVARATSLTLFFVVLVQAMEFALTNNAVKSAVLMSGKPGCFIAGADIAMLDSAKDKNEVRKNDTQSSV